MSTQTRPGVVLQAATVLIATPLVQAACCVKEASNPYHLVNARGSHAASVTVHEQRLMSTQKTTFGCSMAARTKVAPDRASPQSRQLSAGGFWAPACSLPPIRSYPIDR